MQVKELKNASAFRNLSYQLLQLQIEDQHNPNTNATALTACSNTNFTPKPTLLQHTNGHTKHG